MDQTPKKKLIQVSCLKPKFVQYDDMATRGKVEAFNDKKTYIKK